MTRYKTREGFEFITDTSKSTDMIFQDDLNVLQKQFTLVQKKLLVQYGSLPPRDCGPLELLMRDTHGRLVDTVKEILQCRENVNRYLVNTYLFVTIS